MNASSFVGRGFDAMRPPLADFVIRELRRVSGDSWWRENVIPKVSESTLRNIPQQGDVKTLVNSLDILALFQILEGNWFEVFKQKLTKTQKGWLAELTATRHDWAHAAGEGMNIDDAIRALDTMSRFMENINSAASSNIKAIMKEARPPLEEKKEPSKTVKVIIPQKTGYQSPWRNIAEPHSDVAKGIYRQAEFAADLAQVIQNKAVPEYQDPEEFFNRTFITDGMKRMLIKTLQRVCNKGGEPVIQLKTAFGGGKTHSMLALYHLMRSKEPEKLPNIKPVLDEAQIITKPKVVTAVLVGTYLDPAKQSEYPALKGVKINTLWGEMTAQLAIDSGNLKLFDLIKENDAKGIAPGSKTLTEILDICGPCIILIDELVVYARNLFGYKQGAIPAGTFENVLSFIQELTEAAKASKNSLIVASLPESDTEAGGDAGINALRNLEHIFSRIEAVWNPVDAEEGFEIVRRRLFRPITDQEAVSKICKAYFDIYQSNKESFPLECREPSYLAKMKNCYPIHPEVFDRLYNDWATLDDFQRTRGVLRFMAALIFDLYRNNDSDAMIMPGSIRFGNSEVRDELTRYLSRGWDAIIDKEVDGKNAVPQELDTNNPYLGKNNACTRVARTIFLGSAPATGSGRIRGIDGNHVRLGSLQPGDTIPTYNDAHSKLNNELSYLYSSSGHSWFDTKPTLRKLVAERAKNGKETDILHSIEENLRLELGKSTTLSIHPFPSSSSDVGDEPRVSLVVLKPQQTYKKDGSQCLALKTAKEIFETRGNSPRINRNMILFLAPDTEAIEQLKSETSYLLAWETIKKESDDLDLDRGQRSEIEDRVKQYKSAVKERLHAAYIWLLLPSTNGTSSQEMKWECIQMPSTGEDIISHLLRKLKENEQLVDRLSPKVLLMEITKIPLWKDDKYIPIKELWENYTRRLYLQRISNFSVLDEAIRVGVKNGDFFAYADGMDETGRFQGLCLGEKGYANITQEGFLVKLESAELQIKKEEEDKTTTTKPSPSDLLFPDDNHPKQPQGTTSPAPTKAKNTRFYAGITVDPQKLGTTAGQIRNDILQHFNELPSISISVSLDIQVTIPEGTPPDIVRTVNENCNTLGIKGAEFRDE
jgi:predicted AAA+ superfamily ATPase